MKTSDSSAGKRIAIISALVLTLSPFVGFVLDLVMSAHDLSPINIANPAVATCEILSHDAIPLIGLGGVFIALILNYRARWFFFFNAIYFALATVFWWYCLFQFPGKLAGADLFRLIENTFRDLFPSFLVLVFCFIKHREFFPQRQTAIR